jgi:hypothetical protein
MVADYDGGSGFEEFVGGFHVFGAGFWRVFDAPVDGDYEEIALGAGCLDGFEDLGFVGTGSTA